MATTNNTKTARSFEELNLRYLRFSLMNELDEDLAPEEQSAFNDKHERWLDAHMEQRESLKQSETFYDSVEIARIQHDLMERFSVPESDILRICARIEPKPTAPREVPQSVIGNLIL